MFKKNQHGFTLIESIVAFVFLALAGVIFAFSLMNISHLMSKSSLLKTESDNVYHQVISSPTRQEEKSITISINGQTYTQKIESLSQTLACEDHFSLSKFQTSFLVPNLPDDAFNNDENNTYETIDAQFVIVKDLSHIPLPNHQLDKAKWKYTTPLLMKDALTIKTPSFLLGYHHESDAFLKQYPNQEELKTVYHEIQYQNVIDEDHCDVYWYAIQNDYEVIVYGVLIPKQKSLLVITEDWQSCIVLIDENGQIDDHSLPQGYFQIDDKVYSHEDICHGQFIQDTSKTFYIAFQHQP